MSFITWSAAGGRAADVARAFSGEVFATRPAVLDRGWLTPLRWAVSGLATARYLATRRPRALVVTNPPIWPALICLAYARLTSATLVLDSHPGGFGAQQDRVARRLQVLHMYVMRRAEAVLVTSRRWAQEVRDAGGRPIVFHEAPPEWDRMPAKSPRSAFQVLFICVFGADEPVTEVLGAAQALPDVAVHITGDPGRARSGVLDSVPPAVRLTGYLRGPTYLAELRNADLVMSLSTEPTSVMRAACEAVWAERPLLVTDTPLLREVFPYAIHVTNDVEAIRAGIVLARQRHRTLQALAPHARRLQFDRWERQAEQLSASLTHSLRGR